jgi:hypothetical protein
VSIYQLAPDSNKLLNDTEWKFTLKQDKVDIIIKNDVTPKDYTKINKPINTYDLSGFLTNDYIEFPGVSFTDINTFAKLKILTATFIGKYVDSAPVKLYTSETAPIVNALSAATDASATATANATFYEYPQGTDATVRTFILRLDTQSSHWKMIELKLKNETNKLKVKINAVRYLSKSVTGTTLMMWEDPASLTFTGANDAVNGIATSNDITETRSRGFGIQHLKVGFTDLSLKPYYVLNDPKPKAITQVDIQKFDEASVGNNPFLVVIRDGAEGVAAQKRVVPQSSLLSKVSLSFLQEDIRPLIVYEPSKIKTGFSCRFESAVGKRYFLQSTGVIKQLPSSSTNTAEQETDARTKFQLQDKGASITTSSTTAPVNRIATTTAPTAYLTMNTATDNVVAQVSPTTNSDWSIVPAINGAYAFVSIMLTNTPGYCIVAKKNATGDDYTATAKLVDLNDDVEMFHACWRLYPAI